MLGNRMGGEDRAGSESLKSRLKGTNISWNSFLATDYLNHFNEAFMLLEMAADMPEMPEMIDEMDCWQAKSYEQHFAESGLAISNLAIEAYGASPPEYRQPFDKLTAILLQLIVSTVNDARGLAVIGDGEQMARTIRSALGMMHRIHAAMTCIINDPTKLMDQGAIDRLLVESTTACRANASARRL